VRRGAAQGLGAIAAAAHEDTAIKAELLEVLQDGGIDGWVRRGAAQGLGAIAAAAHEDTAIKAELLEVLQDGGIDGWVRRGAAQGLGAIVEARTKQQVDSDMRARESRSSERRQGDRSGEGSSQGEQVLDQMRRIVEERDRLQTQLTNAQQELGQTQTQRDQAQTQLTSAQQEHNQVRGERDRLQTQLRDAQQEHNRAQEQLRKMQQEHNPTQEQLRLAQQNLNRTQEQLRRAQQERSQAQQSLNRTREQLTNAQQERDQAQQDLDSTQEQLTNAQQERDQAQQELEQLRLAQQMGDAGVNSSRGDSRADEALPTTVEGMQGQLEGEHRRLHESFERMLQLQEGIQRTLLERGEEMPENERLNELLRQGIWNLVGYHRLDETLFPRQEFGGLPDLRQRVRDSYLQTVSESTSSRRLSQGQVASEFVDQLPMKIPTPVASHGNVVGRNERGEDPVALFTLSQERKNEHR
jgi:predicted  nucleic acid-binding Zn-ribbon protein